MRGIQQSLALMPRNAKPRTARESRVGFEGHDPNLVAAAYRRSVGLRRPTSLGQPVDHDWRHYQLSAGHPTPLTQFVAKR